MMDSLDLKHVVYGRQLLPAGSMMARMFEVRRSTLVVSPPSIWRQPMPTSLDASALDQIFRKARTHNVLAGTVTDEQHGFQGIDASIFEQERMSLPAPERTVRKVVCSQ
jgi:hypothetical protein